MNDDGPPSPSSPYVASFVQAVHEAGHSVSVVLPSTQNSGMGKAYNFGEMLQPFLYIPESGSNKGNTHPWVLVNGTPASCVQLGIYHLFQDRGSVDLVISGPNYGHNLTSVYNLASGTVGGALEGALCGKKAVSLSFAFGNHMVPGVDGVHDPALITSASRVSIRLVEQLVQQWHANVDVYHINVPSFHVKEPPRVVWTTAVRSSLSQPSIFQPHGEPVKLNSSNDPTVALQPFMWAPRFTDVARSLEDSPQGTDAWALKQRLVGSVQ